MRTWWNHKEPARKVPRTSTNCEYTTPDRYHRKGLYHSLDPSTPLWRQVRISIASPCAPSLHRAGDSRQWYLEDVVIVNPDLAARVMQLLVRYRPQDTTLRYSLSRQSDIPLNPEVYPPSRKRGAYVAAH